MPSQSLTQKYLSAQPSAPQSLQIAPAQSSLTLQLCQTPFSELLEVFNSLRSTARYQDIATENPFRVLRITNPVLVSANRNDVHAHPSGQVKFANLFSSYW